MGKHVVIDGFGELTDTAEDRARYKVRVEFMWNTIQETGFIDNVRKPRPARKTLGVKYFTDNSGINWLFRQIGDLQELDTWINGHRSAWDAFYKSNAAEADAYREMLEAKFNEPFKPVELVTPQVQNALRNENADLRAEIEEVKRLMMQYQTVKKTGKKSVDSDVEISDK